MGNNFLIGWCMSWKCLCIVNNNNNSNNNNKNNNNNKEIRNKKLRWCRKKGVNKIGVCEDKTECAREGENRVEKHKNSKKKKYWESEEKFFDVRKYFPFYAFKISLLLFKLVFYNNTHRKFNIIKNGKS